jgi:lysophospholipase L1-like esterase
MCFVIIEIGFRINGKYISYNERTSGGSYGSPFRSSERGWDNTPKPHSLIECNKVEFNYPWTANNEGLKDKNLSLQKRAKRILVFGDSFTEGEGAPAEGAYPRQLENLIHDSLDSKAAVINCGISASDIFTEFKLLSGKMLKYQPDYVLVTFNSTDLYEFTTRGGFERFKDGNKVEYRKAPWFEFLYAYSYVARRIVHDAYHYDYMFLTPPEHDKMQQVAIEKTLAAIDSFNLLCRAGKIGFGMVFHPMGNEYPVVNYLNAPLIAYCQKGNIPFVDENTFLINAGIDSSNVKDIYWPVDGHFNSRGYELLAKCAYELFATQGWLVSKSSDSLSLN